MKKIIIVLLSVVMLTGCSLAATNEKEVKINGTHVISLGEATGTKRVVGGGEFMDDHNYIVERIYSSDDVTKDDLISYTETLHKEGYIKKEESEDRWVVENSILEIQLDLSDANFAKIVYIEK